MVILTMDDVIGIAVYTILAVTLFFCWVITAFERKRKKNEHADD